MGKTENKVYVLIGYFDVDVTYYIFTNKDYFDAFIEIGKYESDWLDEINISENKTASYVKKLQKEKGMFLYVDDEILDSDDLFAMDDLISDDFCKAIVNNKLLFDEMIKDKEVVEKYEMYLG